jgi:hypothetical protein
MFLLALIIMAASIVIDLKELWLVWRWSNSYPSVHRWGWKDGPLSQKQALNNPEFG